MQLETAANAASSRHIPLTYPDGIPIRDTNGVQILAVDNPYYLGPLISATCGTPVRIKYSNLLPKGRFNAATRQRNGDLFIPVDTTLMGTGLAPNGTELYAENRATVVAVIFIRSVAAQRLPQRGPGQISSKPE